ncbi:Tol-Pal system protein TolB [Anaplasma phagocytophilum]|uniref:WD40-like Beta Propeller Repeat family protein n=1 Tax=Anaplasma phagocytophilum str. ApWI1 TaxID=1359155 RepID=A0A0F3PZY7_ANAPH|nr:Tol-Pal system protein TolB [Anaplasma phagocytophilum]KJZ98934.1 WD40-like Beta Propeller Repeat family protein [Anaplasma phagocytophilum str. CR1007]AGR80861.1 hypothetical protein WSQ_04795 [Anaplasma phagocytophilum str. JM]AGR82116.1 hypothetical protein YYY_04800 [Anaplasma phagocytophilum str. Dog2]EOA61273.1 translocation protein TolB [Anaplasma phagocytophilum str. HGE1]KJV60405.1 WD40-like Beta Propeller Repeat family protein [Anaplasma phagocytophilum str. Webster]
MSIRLGVATFFIFLLFCCGGAVASLRLSITKGNTGKLSIAFAPLHSFESNLAQKIGESCTDIILKDLNNTGLFDARIEILDPTSDGAAYSNVWRELKHDILLTGNVQELSHGRMGIKLFVWDVAAEKKLSGKSFNFEIGGWRRAAHTVADHIYTRITGNGGYFDSKIAYIADMLGERRIALMDYDGANSVYASIANNGWLSFPRFSPDTKSIVYTLTSQSSPSGRVMLYDMRREVSSLLIGMSGIVSSVRFSPSGREILLSESLNGSTDIYSFSLISKKLTRLTADEFMNTSASYSPDEKSIVFASDRDGGSHLYIMDADGSNPRKISSGSGRYMSPVWSPNGTWIAFTKVKGARCYIGIMRPNGSKERMIASDCFAEGPSWAPNGQAVLYTKHVQRVEHFATELAMVDLSSMNRRAINTPSDALIAHWSNTMQN